MANEKKNLLNFLDHAPRLRDTVTAAVNGSVLTWDAVAKGWYANASGGAPANGKFVLMQAIASLPLARVLAFGEELTATDGGAGENITITVTAGGVTNAMLTNASVTVTAGSALSGGGAVALGSSATLSVVVDDATMEIALGGGLRVKDAGITPAKLAFQPRKDTFVGNGLSATYNLSTRILAPAWRDGLVVSKTGSVLVQVPDSPATVDQYEITDNGVNTSITLGANLGTDVELLAMYWA